MSQRCYTAERRAGGIPAWSAGERFVNVRRGICTMESTGERKRVLVVDDDPTVRRLVREAIEPALIVIDAEDGRAALRAFFQQRPDLVVLDILLPDQDGRDVLQR